jgi:hypothetical protein
MKRHPNPGPLWKWDAYKAFHVNQAPLIYFDTGELICTVQCPPVDARREYNAFNVELTTSKDVGTLWAPDGTELKKAWLDDNGMQYLLVDKDLNVAVRTDGCGRRWRNQDGTLCETGNKKAEYVPGIPDRFQVGCFAYIGGPGCMPVSIGKVTAWVPHRVALTTEQREHVDMIDSTARAALKLTDHEAVHYRPHQSATSISKGCPLDLVLNAMTWQDIPKQHLPQLFHYGVARKKCEYARVLTVQP